MPRFFLDILEHQYNKKLKDSTKILNVRPVRVRIYMSGGYSVYADDNQRSRENPKIYGFY